MHATLPGPTNDLQTMHRKKPPTMRPVSITCAETRRGQRFVACLEIRRLCQLLREYTHVADLRWTCEVRERLLLELAYLEAVYWLFFSLQSAGLGFGPHASTSGRANARL